jgi:pilus assembly protein CpaE
MPILQRPIEPTRGHLIAVRGTKGGVGTTAVATSLAVAVHRQTKTPTVLVDGYFYGGDAPVALNLTPHRSIVDLLPQLDRLDDDILSTTLARHSSGVVVLAAPSDFEQAESIKADSFQQVLDALRTRYAYVIVDCSPFLDQTTIAALDQADTVLLVTTPDLAALKNAARFLRLGARLGYAEHKLRLLVNRFNQPGAVSSGDLEQHLSYRVSFRVPNDNAVSQSLNRGEPVASGKAAKALTRLARTVVSNLGWEDQPHQSVSFFRRWRPDATEAA